MDGDPLIMFYPRLKLCGTKLVLSSSDRTFLVSPRFKKDLKSGDSEFIELSDKVGRHGQRFTVGPCTSYYPVIKTETSGDGSSGGYTAAFYLSCSTYFTTTRRGKIVIPLVGEASWSIGSFSSEEACEAAIEAWKKEPSTSVPYYDPDSPSTVVGYSVYNRHSAGYLGVRVGNSNCYTDEDGVTYKYTGMTRSKYQGGPGETSYDRYSANLKQGVLECPSRAVRSVHDLKDPHGVVHKVSLIDSVEHDPCTFDGESTGYTPTSSIVQSLDHWELEQEDLNYCDLSLDIEHSATTRWEPYSCWKDLRLLDSPDVPDRRYDLRVKDGVPIIDGEPQEQEE